MQCWSGDLLPKWNRIVLLDGETLEKLMIEPSLGVAKKSTVKITALDTDN